jgi:hypothetical protein
MSDQVMVSICKLILIIGFMYIIYICTIADKRAHTIATQNKYTVIKNNTNTTL